MKQADTPKFGVHLIHKALGSNIFDLIAVSHPAHVKERRIPDRRRLRETSPGRQKNSCIARCSGEISSSFPYYYNCYRHSPTLLPYGTFCGTPFGSPFG